MGRAYESLVNQTERRENLERIVRLKLESEVIRLNEDNKDFKGQWPIVYDFFSDWCGTQ